MAKVFYLHWHQVEAGANAAPLVAAGHEVSCHWSAESLPKWGDDLPDVVVISLDRLPSHGRDVAGWVWEAKKRRHVPIVFAGGQPDKVKAKREKFPRAVFCTAGEVVATVEQVRSGV